MITILCLQNLIDSFINSEIKPISAIVHGDTVFWKVAIDLFKNFPLVKMKVAWIVLSTFAVKMKMKI